MIPTKVKDLIPEVAEQIGIPEEDLANIMSFYFKEIKKELSELGHLHFRFAGLGTLTLMGWLLDEKIKDCKCTLEMSIKPENIQKLKKELKNLQNAKVMWEAERQARRDMAVVKKEYYKNKSTDNELERENTTGLAE